MSSDVVVFQHGVDYIADWANKWQLKLASVKCQFIRVGLPSVFTALTLLVGHQEEHPARKKFSDGVLASRRDVSMKYFK